jgi:predicted secreted protein
MGDPVVGKNAEFRRWNSTSGAWELIAKINNVDFGSGARDMHDVTVLESPGGYREYIPGYRTGGTVTLSMVFNRDSYETMQNDFESDDKQNYEIVLPDSDNTSLEFEGYVSEMSLAVPATDPITSEVTIQITGQPNIESGSGPSPG